MASSKTNLTKTLKELDEIVSWFELADGVDVEEGLRKVKTGAELVKKGRARLAEVENSFAEITKDLDDLK